MSVEIALYAHGGIVVAHARVDDEDAALALLRWNISGGGYATRGHKSRSGSIYMHRQILGLTDSRQHVDHINGDKLDNRRSNLRVGTQALNNQNRPGQLNAASRFRGVSLDPKTGKWLASVTVDGVAHNLGRFRQEVDAAQAADEFRLLVMPFAQPDAELGAYLAEEKAA
jgi:hypothetical protein